MRLHQRGCTSWFGFHSDGTFPKEIRLARRSIESILLERLHEDSLNFQWVDRPLHLVKNLTLRSEHQRVTEGAVPFWIKGGHLFVFGLPISPLYGIFNNPLPNLLRPKGYHIESTGRRREPQLTLHCVPAVSEIPEPCHSYKQRPTVPLLAGVLRARSGQDHPHSLTQDCARGSCLERLRPAAPLGLYAEEATSCRFTNVQPLQQIRSVADPTARIILSSRNSNHRAVQSLHLPLVSVNDQSAVPSPLGKASCEGRIGSEQRSARRAPGSWKKLRVGTRSSASLPRWNASSVPVFSCRLKNREQQNLCLSSIPGTRTHLLQMSTQTRA